MTDYGASDTSTTTLGANQFPISETWTPNAGFSATEGGPQSTDSGGKKSAPVSMYVKDGGDVAQGLSTDANTVNSVMGRLTKIRDLLLATLTVTGTVTANVGTPAGSPSYVFKSVQNVAVTAGTPVAIWTPAAGKKFRLIGMQLWPIGGSVFAIFFEDGTGNEFLRIPRLSSANFTPVPTSLAPNGYLSTTANNKLFIDVSLSGSVEGFVYGTEE